MQRINTLALTALLLASTALGGCERTLDKLEQVGQQPKMSGIENPQVSPDYKPMTWPMPEAQPPSKQYANSLWQTGSRAFFRDQRAARVGDILKVNISVNDQAVVNNETEGKRQSSDTASAANVFGLENKLLNLLPNGNRGNPATLLTTSGNVNNKGTGKVTRKDQIETQVAAIVTQVLPNGNLVIEGRQELRVNFDVREIGIRGVVRPQDILADNTIESSQIAEARIIYGGRGQLMEMQQPRWGEQVLETVSPF
jgi:flagellar L-ring protein precursor FlgH